MGSGAVIEEEADLMHTIVWEEARIGPRAWDMYVRAFDDPHIPHPSGSIDPARDARAMEEELILADLGLAERAAEPVV